MRGILISLMTLSVAAVLFVGKVKFQIQILEPLKYGRPLQHTCVHWYMYSSCCCCFLTFFSNSLQTVLKRFLQRDPF